MGVIVVLEDDEARVREMLSCLSRRAGRLAVEVFETAPEMIERFETSRYDVDLISLDNDLMPADGSIRALKDPGCGLDVAGFDTVGLDDLKAAVRGRPEQRQNPGTNLEHLAGRAG